MGNLVKINQPEVWLRGPLNNVLPLLQPVVHALLQSREEINDLMASFPDSKLWEKLSGLASVGFHLQHLTGVLDRLFTYADNRQLDTAQLKYLTKEGMKTDISSVELVNNFNKQVDHAISRLSNTYENSLTQLRGVGRAQLPSTVIGILVHAAEHTMRHTGQLIVTVKVITSTNDVDKSIN